MELSHFRQALSIKTNLLRQVGHAISVRHHGIRTEEAYLNWIYTHVWNKGRLGVQRPVDSLSSAR